MRATCVFSWAVCTLLITCSVGTPEGRPTNKQFMEIEKFAGIDGNSWKKVSANEIGVNGLLSGAAAVFFKKGGDTKKILRGKLRRRLSIDEKVKVFCRALVFGAGRSVWLEVSSGGGKVAFNIRSAAGGEKRVWKWTEGKILMPPVGGDDIALAVTSTDSDVVLDVLYLTTDLAEEAPPKYTTSAENMSPRMNKGLMFYADYDDTAAPLYAWKAPPPPGDYHFDEGMVGKALHIVKGNFNTLPHYPTKNNFPYEQGTIALWFKPDWNDPTDTGQNYTHLLSVSVPGRFYLVAGKAGVAPSVFFPEKGDFEPRSSGRGIYYVPGGAYRGGWKKGTWYHFAWSWGKDASFLYVNGERLGTGKGIPKNIEKSLHFGSRIEVGGYLDNKRPMNGCIDELVAWDRMLSDEEVKFLFESGKSHQSFLPENLVKRLRAERDRAKEVPLVTVPNLIENGSFEAGCSNFFYAQNPYFAPVHFSTGKFDVVEETAFHGRRSLRITIPPKNATRIPSSHYGSPGSCLLQTLAYRLNPGQTFTFSCWIKVKSDAGLKVTLGSTPVNKDCWGTRTMKTLSIPAGTHDWQRIALAARPMKSPDNLHTLFLSISNPGMEKAIVYLDGLQVSPGEAALKEKGYRYAYAVTGTLASPVLANIFKRGKDALRLNVCLANQSPAAQKDVLLLRVYDFWNAKVFEKEYVAEFGPNEIRELTCPLPIQKYGIFRAELVRKETQSVVDEAAFSVLPDLGRVEALGVHAFYDEYSLDVAARFGATWNRCWDNERPTGWSRVQPDGPEFRWEYSDAKINLALSKGFKVLGVLYHVHSYERSWVTNKRPHWLYEKAGGTNRGAVFLENKELLAGWKRYVREVVSRYKGKITYWELLNEPYNQVFGAWSPDDYMKLLRNTAPIVKAANPRAKVVAPCTYMLPKWCEPMIDKGLLNYTDVFSYHGYSMGNEALATMKNWASADGKDRPIFDTENSGMSSSQFFRRSYLGARFSGYRHYQRAAASLSKAFLRGRGHGTQVMFHYWMRPYPPYLKYGTLLAFDGTIRPAAVTYAIAGWMIDSMESKEVMRLGNYVDCYVFGKGDEGIAALWDRRPFLSEPQSQMALFCKTDTPQAYDMMGNAVTLEKKGEFTIASVTAFPIYLRSPKIDVLTALLKGAKVVSNGEKTFVMAGTVKMATDGKPALLLKIYNNSLDERTGTITFPAVPPGFAFAKETRTFTVAANRQLLLTLPLTEVPPVARRAKFLWRITDEKGAEEEGEIPISLLLVRRRNNIVLDGDLKEWEGLPAAVMNTKEQVVVEPKNWRGEHDCSGRVRAAWDAENLYLAVEVTDDRFLPPPKPSWRWDSVELFFDSDLYGDWGTASSSPDDFIMTFEAQSEAIKGFSGPDTIQGASSVEGNVRRTELKIPLSQLKLEAAVGTAFGFDIAIDDADQEKKTRKLQIVWTGTAHDYKDPSHYGVLVFVK